MQIQNSTTVPQPSGSLRLDLVLADNAKTDIAKIYIRGICEISPHQRVPLELIRRESSGQLRDAIENEMQRIILPYCPERGRPERILRFMSQTDDSSPED
jgi:hypothetical protein